MLSTHLAIDDVRACLVLQVGPGLAGVDGVLKLLQASRSGVQEVLTCGRGWICGVARELGPKLRDSCFALRSLDLRGSFAVTRKSG